jgi:AraC-like DNA-binding protein
LTGPTRPLDAFPLVRTQNVEELRASLARIIAKPALEPVGRDRTLCAIHNHCQLQHVGVSYGSYGTAIRFRFPEPTIFSQIFPVRGKAEVLIDGTSVMINPDRSAVVSADAATFNMTSSAEYERLILNIGANGLSGKLAAITGLSIRSPLRFFPLQDFARPAARILRDHFIFLVRQLSSGALLPPLVVAEFEQTLMVMFLHANQHNYSDVLDQEPPDAAPWQVRRAEGYIEANWDRPMSVEAIAAASGVSARSLFRHFKQSRGYSPMEFLRQVRLRRARERLQRPDEPTTVAEVAFVCGFVDVGRFSQDYFRAFGERPSQTLHRANSAADNPS